MDSTRYGLDSLSGLIADAQASRENAARSALDTITAVNNDEVAGAVNGFRFEIEKEITTTGETKRVKIITRADGQIVKKMSAYNSNPLGKRKPNEKGYNSHKRDTAILLGEDYAKNGDGLFVCPEGCGFSTAKGKFLVARHVAESCKARKARLQREAANVDVSVNVFARIKLAAMSTGRERKDRVRRAAKVVAKKTASAANKTTTAGRTSAKKTAADGLAQLARSALVSSDAHVPAAAETQTRETVDSLIERFHSYNAFCSETYESRYPPVAVPEFALDPALEYQN